MTYRPVQRLYWRQDFVKSDQLYLLDGARVIYDERPGILYEHQLIRDNMPVLEKSQIQFQNLPANEKVEFSLNSEDEGLFSFLELRFFRKNRLVAIFAEPEQKTIKFDVPEYDNFVLRVRVRGAGQTRLLNVTARVLSLPGLLFAGDTALSGRIGVMEIAGSGETLLVSFSADTHYLSAEFFTESGPQLHFASLDGQFDAEIILQKLRQMPQMKLKIFNAPPELRAALSNLTEYAIIREIEYCPTRRVNL